MESLKSQVRVAAQHSSLSQNEGIHWETQLEGSESESEIWLTGISQLPFPVWETEVLLTPFLLTLAKDSLLGDVSGHGSTWISQVAHAATEWVSLRAWQKREQLKDTKRLSPA